VSQGDYGGAEDFSRRRGGSLVFVFLLFGFVLLSLFVFVRHVFNGKVCADDFEMIEYGNGFNIVDRFVCTRLQLFS